MHQYADIYLLQRQTLHVSGVTAPILRSPKTVFSTSGIGHGIGTATSFHRGLFRTGVGEPCGM
jgi:hypothetical protein